MKGLSRKAFPQNVKPCIPSRASFSTVLEAEIRSDMKQFPTKLQFVPPNIQMFEQFIRTKQQ